MPPKLLIGKHKRVWEEGKNLSEQTLNREIRSRKVENRACAGSSRSQFEACIAQQSDNCRYGKHPVLHPGTTLYAGWSVHRGEALKRAILKTLRIGLKRV